MSRTRRIYEARRMKKIGKGRPRRTRTEEVREVNSRQDEAKQLTQARRK